MLKIALINIDFENIDQYKNFIDEQIFYLASSFIATADGFFNLVESICGVAEAVFKGSFNIIGAVFSDKYNSYREIMQLSGATLIGVFSLPIVFFRV